jgi:formylglycine-generating enzyme required for sulfatase activity
VDEVGDEAFVNDIPLADEIERSFAQDRDKPTKPTSPKQSSSKPTKAPPGKPASAPRNKDQEPTGRGKPTQGPPIESKPESRGPEVQSGESIRGKRKEPATREEVDERQPKREDREPPPVLKRRRWSTSEDDSDDVDDKPSPDEKAARSTKQEPVTERPKKRFTIDLSPKAQQLLRWAPLSLPVLLILFFVFYLFGGSGGRPKIRHGTEMSVDPGALEAQATALYDAAVQAYRAGQTEQALMSLQQVIAQFPLTRVGAQARAALDRHAQGQPLFEGLAAQSTSTPEPVAPPPEVQMPTATQPPPEKKKIAIGIPTTPPSVPTTTDSTADNSIGATPPKLPGAPPQGSTLAKSNTKTKQLPQGFEAVESAGVHSSGWPIEIICLRDSSHMMLVPAGEFEMGNNNGEPNAKPVHRVRLKTFYIDKFEVTLLQYKQFLERRRLEKTPYRDLSQAALAAAPSDRHPVVGVAWRDANTYVEWAGKSLPTEAQWEKAARGTDGRLFPWGSGQPTWEKPRESKQIDRVGSFTWDVSVYGCFDMAGNAWEWCADWYDPKYYHTSPTEDPDGPKVAPTPQVFKDQEKVYRGGSVQWDLTWRGLSGIQEEPLPVGFRTVLNIELVAPRPTAAAPTTSQPSSGRIPATAPKIPPGGYKF